MIMIILGLLATIHLTGVAHALDVSVDAADRAQVNSTNTTVKLLESKISSLSHAFAINDTLLIATETRLATTEADLVIAKANLTAVQREIARREACAVLQKLYHRTSGCIAL